MATKRAEALPSQEATKRRGKGCQLFQGRFPYKKEIFHSEYNQLWEQPPHVVEFPSLEVFKVQMNRMLDSLTWVPFLMKDCVRQFSDVPSNLGCSVILQKFCEETLPGVQEFNSGCV